jgi:hypothetical protein
MLAKMRLKLILICPAKRKEITYVLEYDQISGQYLPNHVSEVFEKTITTSGYADFDGDNVSEYAIGMESGIVVLYSMPDLSVKRRLQIEYQDTTIKACYESECSLNC